MPAKCRWLINIPEIIERLTLLDVPVIDRVIFERVFEVRRRRAIDLMKRFGGGFESGNAGFLDRLEVIRQLRQFAAGDEIARERERRERLAEHIDEASRYRSAAAVRIPISPNAMDRSFPDLPNGVCLEGGKLVAEYTTAEELLQQLFELAQAAANNFDAFRETVEAEARIRRIPRPERTRERGRRRAKTRTSWQTSRLSVPITIARVFEGCTLE